MAGGCSLYLDLFPPEKKPSNLQHAAGLEVRSEIKQLAVDYY